MKHEADPIIPNPADLLGPVVEAVLQAGFLLRAEFHRPDGPRGIHGNAPIDVEIEEHLREQLLVLHACDWQGEEIPRSLRGTMDVWGVDPQDGTRAFLKGLRGSAISVALMREARPVLGVVYAPTAPDDGGDLFTCSPNASKAGGGFYRSPSNVVRGARLRRYPLWPTDLAARDAPLAVPATKLHNAWLQRVAVDHARSKERPSIYV